MSTTLASSFLDQLLALGIAINAHFNVMQIRVLQFHHNASAIAKQSTIVVKDSTLNRFAWLTA